MKKRTLGRSDLQVSPICFGGNVFGWTIDEQQSHDILDHFAADGFNFIDTADVYSRWKTGNTGGESESIIGNWLQKRNSRQDMIIATKVGHDMGQGKTLKKNWILKEVEASLKRLKTDYIDLYYSHYDDPSLPVEEPLMAYEQLIKEGKVRWIGASNFEAKRLQEALEASHKNNLPLYQAYQPGYNLYDRIGFEKEHEKICVVHDMGVVPYYALASGFLTGKYRSIDDLEKSARGGGVKKYLDERGSKILSALDQVSAKHNTSQAAIALAWLIQHPSITAPIASVTNLDQLKSFTAAVHTNLDQSDISALNNASFINFNS